MKGKQRTLLNSIGKLALLLLFSLLSTALSAQNKKIRAGGIGGGERHY